MQIQPAPALRELIKHYLFLEPAENSCRKMRLFSDGNPGMIFTASRSFCIDTGAEGKKQFLPSCCLYGQLSRFKDILWMNTGTVLIVVLQPTGLSYFNKYPASELKDGITDCRTILGNAALNVENQIAEARSTAEQVTILNNFFLTYLKHATDTGLQLVIAAVNQIQRQKGNTTVQQLEKFLGYTERHIERLFKQYIGLSPKKYANAVQQNHFLKLLAGKNPHENLSALSYEAGYADQAHSIKSFSKNTGITPGEYIRQPKKITSNFLLLG